MFWSRGCKRIVLVGHSLGGALAAIVGARITTFPVTAANFNAPGCKGFERAGRWVDEDDQRLAKTIDDVRGLGSGSPNYAQRVSALVPATLQTAQLAARRAMEATVRGATVNLKIPSGNALHVHNVVAVSRLSGGEIVSSAKSGFIGNAPYRVPVDVADPGRAHMIGPLVEALKKNNIGSMRI